MILGDAPGVVLPKSWVITLLSWPTLLQHLHTIAITSNLRIFLLPPPPLLWDIEQRKVAIGPEKWY